jgi:hypothetical protein
MKTTKGQLKKIRNANTGYGWIVFNSGNNEVTEIEVYIGRDNKLRRVGNGECLLPLTFCDDEKGVTVVS